MADLELKSDEEKAQELKAWWKENGTSVVVGIALAIGGMFGWQQWQVHQKTKAEGGSRLFAQLNNENTDSAKKADVLKQLTADFSGTPYSALAALKAAKTACTSDISDKDMCVSLLQQASQSSQEDIAIIAKLRLARAYIANNQLDDAVAITNQKMPTAYSSLVDEIKGDIYFAKKEFDKAREAYDRAILSSAGQNIQFLKMKRDDLGKSTVSTESSEDQVKS